MWNAKGNFTLKLCGQLQWNAACSNPDLHASTGFAPNTIEGANRELHFLCNRQERITGCRYLRRRAVPGLSLHPADYSWPCPGHSQGPRKRPG
ncbi:protein of unknown function [Pseudomonas sp. JV241A]|nr:protein of unknown function [Pseudomonas sp. JV241A]